MGHAQGLVAITAMGASVAATIAWRARGILRVTVVVKATFALVPDAPMALIAPEPIEPDEQDGDPGFGLRAAGDLAPYLGQTDLLLTGHAHAVPGARSVTARFAVVRDEDTLIEKALDLDVPAAARLAPGARAPGALRVPLAGMSPLSRHWPVRKRLLQGLDPRALEGPIAEVPESFDWTYFQAAPLDQRIDALQGDEWILLGCMHPGLAEFGSRLPGARGAARLYGRAPALRGRAIPLTEDTLCIDVDRQLCSVLFRGHFPVSSEREFASLHIMAGVELPGRPLTWVDPFPLAATPPSQPTSARAPSAPLPRAPIPAAPQHPLEGTMALSREEAAKLWTAQATPFKASSAPAAARVPSVPAAKSGPGPLPAPTPSPLWPGAPDPLMGTVAFSDESPLMGTMALSDADAARVKAAQATPFKPSSPKAVPMASAPMPPPRPTAPAMAPHAGAPWTEESNPLFGTMALSDADAAKAKAAQATPFKASSTPAVARVPSAPASKLGPYPLSAPQPAPRWPEASNPLEGTMALSDDDAAKLNAGKLTPFDPRSALVPAAPPARPSQPASDWTEREVPQAAYIPPARSSRPQDEPAAASFSAPRPPPGPPTVLSAPAAAAAGVEPPSSLGEHFLEAMADAGEGAG